MPTPGWLVTTIIIGQEQGKPPSLGRRLLIRWQQGVDRHVQ